MLSLDDKIYLGAMVGGFAGLFVPWSAWAEKLAPPQVAQTVTEAVNASILHGVWFTTPMGNFDLDVFMKLCCFATTMACGYKTWTKE